MLMTRKQFETYYYDVMKQASDIMFRKNEEYGDSNNVFRNFEKIAELKNFNNIDIQDWELYYQRRDVLLSLLGKHIEAIFSNRGLTEEVLLEKVCDSINYLTMLAGMRALYESYNHIESEVYDESN